MPAKKDLTSASFLRTMREWDPSKPGTKASRSLLGTVPRRSSCRDAPKRSQPGTTIHKQRCCVVLTRTCVFHFISRYVCKCIVLSFVILLFHFDILLKCILINMFPRFPVSAILRAGIHLIAFGIVWLFLCEYLIYYTSIAICSWPRPSRTLVENEGNCQEPLQAMILSDTHLLARHAHWLDKLRREWQMERSFQTAVALLKPEVVFILGDIFDEGQNAGDDEFYETLSRFQKMFRADIPVYCLVGNHDIGFHYRIWTPLRRRFEDTFKMRPVQHIQLKGSDIVMLNSIAFEADGCTMCKEAENMLRNVSKELRRRRPNSTRGDTGLPAVRPVVMQHYPMYRPSDEMCRDIDSAPEDEKKTVFREKWECLSEDATSLIMKSLNPRAVFGGHTHHSCFRRLSNGAGEWSVSSFNWRNKILPSFLLVSICPNDLSVSKCFLPNEHVVFGLYGFAGLFFVICFFDFVCLMFCPQNSRLRSGFVNYFLVYEILSVTFCTFLFFYFFLSYFFVLHSSTDPKGPQDL